MALKLAIPDFSFPSLAWEQSLRLVRDLGMEAVDLGLFAGRSHLRPEELLAHPPQATAKVTAALRAHQLEVADIFGQASLGGEDMAVNHPDPSERARVSEFFWRLLEFAVRCNGQHVTLCVGVHFPQESHEDSLKRAADELAWRVDAARKAGVVLAVEPGVDSITSTPAQVDRLIKLTPGLTLTLDYSHFTYQGIPDEEVDLLLGAASHFHARGACKGKLQASMKENTIDFPRILRSMKRTGYKGYVVLEYVWTEWMRCNEVDNLTETVALRDLLRSVHDESGASNLAEEGNVL